MRHAGALFAICLSVIVFPALAQNSETPPVGAETSAATRQPETVKVELKTSLGVIVLSIEKERAPVTAGKHRVSGLCQ